MTTNVLSKYTNEKLLVIVYMIPDTKKTTRFSETYFLFVCLWAKADNLEKDSPELCKVGVPLSPVMNTNIHVMAL